MITIGKRKVGDGQPAFIVAEAGGNHDGKLDNARRLISLAALAGADAVKFQFYRATELYPGRVTAGAIPDHWLPLLKAAAYDNEIDFFCSVFSKETLEVYRQVGPVAVKIASPEATNLDLLTAVVWSGVPAIVATGACDWRDVDRAVNVLRGSQFALLHCLSAYPADPKQLNLAVIPAMRARYSVPVGFSDHTLHPWVASTLAVAAGATIIEKHITPDRTLRGPDHGFALEPEMFRNLVKEIRSAEAMLGDGVKRVMPSEDPTDRRQVTS